MPRIHGLKHSREAAVVAVFPLLKADIPDALKADLPQSKWGRVLSATPVVLAVISTLLAGLASSEMTKAQYDRSLAAQLQSKAGDQWSFFPAKRLRGALQNSTCSSEARRSGLHGEGGSTTFICVAGARARLHRRARCGL
ncbi:MAG: hypothetical protein ACREH8_10020 [Opitutaceae bacterium]